MKPAPLKQGDTIGIIAPSSPPDPIRLQQGISHYKKYGLNIKVGDSVSNEYGYLAGTDLARAQDLLHMFQDEEIKGVFCAYGGYGSARVVEHLDFEIIRKNPKIFWGYSDATFLHQTIYQQTGLVTFHGPMMSSDLGGDIHPFTERFLHQVFKPMTITYDESVSTLQVIGQVQDEVTAPIIGGNLTLLTSTLGTDFEIDTTDKILFIEDVGEEPYRLDRMLNQLRMAGKLQEAKAILVGDFHQCTPVKRQNSLSITDVLTHHITLADTPAITGLQIGHCTPTVSIPLGVNGTISFNQKRIVIEPGVKGG